MWLIQTLLSHWTNIQQQPPTNSNIDNNNSWALFCKQLMSEVALLWGGDTQIIVMNDESDHDNEYYNFSALLILLTNLLTAKLKLDLDLLQTNKIASNINDVKTVISTASSLLCSSIQSKHKFITIFSNRDDKRNWSIFNSM